MPAFMKFTEYSALDALALADLVRKGDVSPAELLQIATQTAGRIHDEFNILTHLAQDRPNALINELNKQAIFAGVPFLVKDLMLPIKGMPMSNGCRAMRGFVSGSDSALTRLIHASGLITFGKTTTSELGSKPLCVSDAFGATLNPWDKQYNSGGSSGGSSVAVATGVVPMAYSSDGGGSIRLPASYCGVFGFKPSSAINRFEDMSKAWGGAAVSHVTTRSVRDSAAYLDITTARVAPDAVSHLANPVDGSCLAEAGRPPEGLKIGLITESPIGTKVDADCIKAAEDAAALCRSLGHQVEIARWNFDGKELMRAFLTVLLFYTEKDVVTMSASLGVSVKDLAIESGTRFIAMAGSGITPERLSLAEMVLQDARQKMAMMHKHYDLILTPAAGRELQASDAVDPKGLEKWLMQLLINTGLASKVVGDRAMDQAIIQNLKMAPFTAIANATGQPAMSVPLYWNEQGLPYGAHFMAAKGQDPLLFALAGQLEQARPWQDKRPSLNLKSNGEPETSAAQDC